MMRRALLVWFLLLLLAPATTMGTAAALAGLESDFQLQEGGQQHFFTWTGAGQAHLLIRPDTRLVVAFSSDNVGVSLWFGEGAEVRAAGPPAMEAVAVGQRLVVDLRSERPVLRLDDAVLDSIRTVRDRQTLGPEGAEQVRRDREAFARIYGTPADWPREVVEAGPGRWEARRSNLDGGIFRARLELPPGAEAVRTGPGWAIRADGPFTLRLVAEVPEAPYGRPSARDVFSPEALALLDRHPDDPRLEAAMRGLLFLAPREKFMAGSWRFLTYFGRDTLLSLMLLDPALTPEAWSRGIRSVLVRLDANGEVAHEEDLGPWAERRRVAEVLCAGWTSEAVPLPAPGEPLSPAAVEALDRPLYDYKMVDDDFLLAPALDRLGARSPEALAALMEDRATRNQVLHNWLYVLRSARPYVDKGSWRHTVPLRSGLTVGDWRDSGEGLGGGRYSMNVNGVLVPAALRAVASTLRRLPEAARAGFEADMKVGAEQAEAWARAWDGALADYRVRLQPTEVRRRLEAFLGTLPAGERAFYEAQALAPGATLRDFLDGRATPESLAGGLEFPALSLDAEGRSVEVMNSDFSFDLFLGEPTAEKVGQYLTLLELPYPVGLSTGVGPVVANAAYSPAHQATLGRGAYHGAVVWAWQSAMLRAGMVRQAHRFPALAPRLRAALASLRRAEAAAGDLAGSELWTFTAERGRWEAVPFGAGTATSRDESNPVQLWSTVYPALLLREEGLRRLEVFHENHCPPRPTVRGGR